MSFGFPEQVFPAHHATLFLLAVTYGRRTRHLIE
jgi:hypothetical protein